MKLKETVDDPIQFALKEKLFKKNYMIGIPSRERSFLMDKRQGVWRYIDPIENKEYPAYTFIRDIEIEDYAPSLHPGSGFVVNSDDYDIAQKRNSILMFAIREGIEFLFVIDDDSILYYRDENLSSKYTSKKENFEKMGCFNRILYESIMLCSPEYPIVGLPLKQGSFSLRYRYPKNIPVIRFVCYHVPTLLKAQVHVDGLGTTFMSDRYVQLFMLEMGYKSLSNCGYCVGDPGTGYKGGCSITRTVEKQSEAAKALQERFPDVVSLKWKEDGLWSERRLDCDIKWRSFLKESENPFLSTEEGDKLIQREGYKRV